MQLFYQKNFEEDQFLDEIDSKHCVKVLRKKLGDEIHVTDGKGNLFHCILKDPSHKKTELEIIHIDREFEKAKRKIKVAIAPTKNIDRTEYFVEKAVEIGVSEISFIQTQNSERKNIKIERIQRIAISAMKQSLKGYLPSLNSLISFEEYLENFKLDATESNFIAHLSDISIDLTKKRIRNNCTILIGPEGDFSTDEVQLAVKKGFEQVSLGTSRLRTETAGIVSVALLNNLN